MITCGSPQSRAGAGDESKYKSGVKKTKQQKRKRKAFIQVAISNFSPSLDLNIQNLSFLRFDFPFSPLKPPQTERHLALFNNNNKKRNTENDGLKLLLLTLNMSSNPPLYICGPLHICSYSDVKCFTHQAQCVSAFTVIHVWRKNKVTFNKKKTTWTSPNKFTRSWTILIFSSVLPESGCGIKVQHVSCKVEYLS